MATNHPELSNQELTDKLNLIEKRLSILEAANKIVSSDPIEYIEIDPIQQIKKVSEDSLIESKIGESGLAWLGNIVLFFGITFIFQFIQNSGFQYGAALFGYIIVAGIFLLAYLLKNTYPKMASIFALNANLILFYVTLRLHFFSGNPIIGNKSIELLLLLIVVAVQLFFYVKKKSITWTGINLVIITITGIVSDNTHFMLAMAVVIAAFAIILLYRYNWIRLLYLSIVLVYLIFLIWFMNNPFMGHPLKAITSHEYGFIYLFAVAAIFSLIALVKESNSISPDAIIGAVILNGIGFSLLLSLFVMSFFKDDYVLLISSVSIFCLLYSVLLEIRSNWKIAAALYALYGFITLSIAVHAIYDFPQAYFLLSIQSILVLLMAIWFRSKFIVFMNTILLISLLIFYLRTSTYIDSINISFSIVALSTARILNWKKNRLTIQTDMLRNVYLLIGYVMVLITLYHLIPDRYITLSWTAAAVVYFVLSLVLKNVKYRYLALGTMLAAAFYLFIVDLARIELVYRIIALMFLAMISIGLSIYYTIKSKRKVENE
ncbi:MAG: hypothetical protein C0591_05400 [Marinilabiliales bacterium]|nr:MAG: hypothetical protein C0591_05400 [Marinilabiliales bacterium]